MEFVSKKIKQSEFLQGSSAATLPGSSNCLSSIESSLLYHSERKFHDEQHIQDMRRGRDSLGLAVPLRINMDRFAAKRVGRLPFLASSNLMDDILTGRCDTIFYEDFMNLPEYMEDMSPPHKVVEKAFGIYKD
ncbi:proteasome maturation protein-like [Drosophila willistoni]|uniref:proteasome maturation protein-like n=1 Tax=Drosophila willistoni TaxID=7260 RepID=UPI001F086C8A|nr:proteasome maturation protein-like [Drosophila willistoni]